MAKHILYCSKTGKPEKPYLHFFETEFQVQMCGIERQNIAKVEVEVTENLEGAYWAWHDFENDELLFIAPSKLLVQMCAPDFFEGDLREGRGNLVRVSINETTKN